MHAEQTGGSAPGRSRGYPLLHVLLHRPKTALIVLLVPVLVLAWHAQEFRIDASSNSIVLENDTDLRFYDETRLAFGSDESVYVAVTPRGDLFAAETLEAIARLERELEAVDGVAGVTSIVDLPLFESPNRGLAALGSGFVTITDPAVDRDLARIELTKSPLFTDALLSRDGTTTALQVKLGPRTGVAELEEARYRLWDLRDTQALTRDQERRLAQLNAELRRKDAHWSIVRRQQIEAIRGVVADHEGIGETHIGGVPMINVDIVDYIESDMVVFGFAVLALALVVLLVLFRSLKWTVLPIMICGLAVLSILGLLGLLDWPATIVTSNFVSLLLIVAMAMLVHIVVRFRELHARHPDWSNLALMARSANDMARPCLYTALTTMVGFGSLYVSQIRPVMDFALIMVIGIAIAYALSFLLFPALNVLLGKGRRPADHLADIDRPSPFTRVGAWSIRHRSLVVLATCVLLVVFGFGLARLDVENRFIDYFEKDSPIHQGMLSFDQKFGGTTPLEVVLDAEQDDFWIDADNLAQLGALSQWLEGQREVGKALSLASLIQVLESAIASDPTPAVRKLKVSAPLLRMLLGRVPKELASEVLDPYVTKDLRRARIQARVRESDKSLSRKDLLARIQAHLDEAPIEGVRARATGWFVLYNNVLQSLFKSQIQTIGAVFIAIWLMFLVLFRSFKVATVAIVPNILPVIAVLGALGWLGIPLDMMTIMTAAVTLGIAVDDTIHFLHRFRKELRLGHDYEAAMVRSLNSIGRAMVFTSLTIIVGFSVLTLSRFVPTVYFGIFTGLAMIVALLAAVSVLPLLVLWFRPFGDPQAREAGVEGSPS